MRPIESGLLSKDAASQWANAVFGIYFPYDYHLKRRVRCTRIWFDPIRGYLAVEFSTREDCQTLIRPILGDSISLEFTCTCEMGRSGRACEHIRAAGEFLRGQYFSNKVLQRQLIEHVHRSLWKVALSELQACTLELAKTEEKAPRTEGLLLWRVGFEGGSFNVVPHECRQKANGQWSKGKKLSWSALHKDPTRWSSAEDRSVVSASLAAASRDRYVVDLVEIARALAGHPRVMRADKPELPANIQIVGLGIGLEQVELGWRLQPTVNGTPLSSFKYTHLGAKSIALDDQEHERLLIATGPPTLFRLALGLDARKIVVPPEAKEQLMTTLAAVENHIAVQLPDTLVEGKVEGDGHIHLRLTPLPTGMQAEIGVRPVADGPWLIPGEGAADFTAQHEGRRVLVNRRIQEEAAAAKQLAVDLTFSDYPATGTLRWNLPTDEEAFDLLDKLRTRPEGDPIVEWPAGEQPRRVIGEITPNAVRVEIKNTRDWFGLSGNIELGGQQFPLTQLLSALKAGHKYIEIAPGQWAEISAEFQDRLAALNDVVHRNRNKLEFDVTAAPIVAEFVDDQSLLKASKAWTTTLKKLDEAMKLDPHPPISLTAELRDYQLEGYRWLRRLAAWGVGGCLADDMGLGKTVQALAVLIDRMEEGPTLVIAPVSVGFNWIRECEKFAPVLKPILYRDTERGDFLSSAREGDVIVVSYGLLLRDAEQFAKVTWGTLVLDEAQFIKNSRTKTAAVVHSLDAKWKLALTGTPAENHLGDLWSLFRAVAPGLFGSWDQFRQRFADRIEKDKDPERRRALARTLRPFVLRRTKSEVLTELPQRTEIQLVAELSDEERKLYEAARLAAVAALSNLEESDTDQRFQVLAALTRLRQLACHPRLLDASWSRSSAKLDLLLETIDELREGRHRALVFSQFTQHLAIVREALDAKGISYQYLDGQTSAKQRMERVDAFQKGEGELFLISLKAGGTGLNLTGADYVIHLDPWWNPAVEDQATDRAHRIGQTRPVTVYRLVAKETIEEQILALHGEKRTLVSGILEGSDQAAKLSTEELVNLIRGGRMKKDEAKPT